MNTRNPSNKTPRELAEIFFATSLEEVTPATLFDADVRIEQIFDLPMMVDNERACDALETLIEDGDLDELFGRELKSAEDLDREPGFLVHGTVQKWDFSGTNFDADGNIANGVPSDYGRYIIYARGATLAEAYKNLILQAVARTTGSIKNGLEAK